LFTKTGYNFVFTVAIVREAHIDAPLDLLSDDTRNVLKLNAEHACEQLVVATPGSAETKNAIEKLISQRLLIRPATNPEAASAMLAGLWLWHDWLDESHTISQGLENATGSFWHAIMHRREGDFSNSKYWYRRVGAHPSFSVIAANAADLVNPEPADKSVFRLIVNGWDPFAFVDLIEAIHLKPNDMRRPLAVSLQRLEWRMLFDFCTRQAVGQ
jgi:hypothetical protein